MTEELYIIKDNKRYRLDLNSPSGITLSFKSPILNDLSKFDSSKSYTFDLPFSSNNSTIFNLLEDVRVENGGMGVRYDVEYIVDGITIIHDGYMYVETIEDKYSAVVTWNILKSFQKLSESELTLRELFDWENNVDNDNNVIPDELGQVIGIVKLTEVGDDSSN